MINIQYLISGTLFGIILYKSEVISWFRIHEMFRFQSFHMYGIICSAVGVGMVSILLIKKLKLKSINGEIIEVPFKIFQHGNWIGGMIFGMGWALTGACPGPLYVHLGVGNSVMIITILSALVGVWVYSYLRPKLPH